MGMDAYELLKEWPDMAKRGAASILEMPAWKMSLDLDGEPASLVLRTESDGDEILLSVLLDDEPLTLGISDTSFFPNLHLVWKLRSALPDTVLLALVERECGIVLQALEKASRRLLTVKGLAGSVPAGERRRNYLLAVSGDEVHLSLTQVPFLDVSFGQLCHIDCSHDSIRSMVRRAFARYAAYPSQSIDVAALNERDLLVLPEDAFAEWRLDGSETDEALVVRCGEAHEFSFGQLVDDDLPPVPDPSDLVLSVRGRVIAEGTCVPCGDVRAFRVDALTT